MRIVHVSCWDTRGGAAIAASRLHLGLLKKGVDSHFLCARSQGDLPNTHLISEGLAFQKDRALNALCRMIGDRQNDPTSFGCSTNFFSNALTKRLHQLKPDIVHLHWVGTSVAPLSALKHIPYPIIWNLHDMWPFSGAEHYDVTGERRYATGYTAENRPKDATGPDVNRWVWQRKMHYWKGLTMHFVGVSDWISDCCRASQVFQNLSKESTVHTIHNGLDRTIFYPRSKAAARAELGLRADCKTILFGAFSATSYVKGGNLLMQALKKLDAGDKPIELAVFGNASAEITAPGTIRYLGSIKDPGDMAKVYSAGDLMVVPSRIESFGQTASEALACGTPVACFDTSGLRDIVRNDVCGIRAKAFDLDDLALAIKNLLKRPADPAAVAQQAEIFDLGLIVDQHLSLYRTCL